MARGNRVRRARLKAAVSCTPLALKLRWHTSFTAALREAAVFVLETFLRYSERAIEDPFLNSKH